MAPEQLSSVKRASLISVWLQLEMGVADIFVDELERNGGLLALTASEMPTQCRMTVGFLVPW